MAQQRRLGKDWKSDYFIGPLSLKGCQGSDTPSLTGDPCEDRFQSAEGYKKRQKSEG